MDIQDALLRLKRKNEILFSKNSPYLQKLTELIQAQNHRTLALWEFELAEGSATQLSKKYPTKHRPQVTLSATRDWTTRTAKNTPCRLKCLYHTFIML